MVNDHLSDVITRIRNGYRGLLPEVRVFNTKIVLALVKVLVKENYLQDFKVEGREIVIGLKYVKKEPALTNIKRVSKPGVRKYSGIRELKRVWGGLGISILSTTKGVLSEKEAKKLKVGGEIIAIVW